MSKKINWEPPRVIPPDSPTQGVTRWPWLKQEVVKSNLNPVPEKKSCAVFTIVRDESTYLPVWLRHYRREFADADIFVLDNDSSDGSTSNLPVNVVRAHNPKKFHHEWIRESVRSFQKHLLQSYECVLYTDVDELVFTDPNTFATLQDYINSFRHSRLPRVRCHGFELIEMPGEVRIDWTKDKVLEQRTFWKPSSLYSKPALACVQTPWRNGFHDLDGLPQIPVDTNIYMVHLHYADRATVEARHKMHASWGTNLGTPVSVGLKLDKKYQEMRTENSPPKACLPEPIPDHLKGRA